MFRSIINKNGAYNPAPKVMVRPICPPPPPKPRNEILTDNELNKIASAADDIRRTKECTHEKENIPKIRGITDANKLNQELMKLLVIFADEIRSGHTFEVIEMQKQIGIEIRRTEFYSKKVSQIQMIVGEWQ